MSKVLRAIIILSIVLAAAMTARSAGQFASAQREASANLAGLARTAQHARDIASLRTTRPAWISPAPHDTPLAPRAAAVIAACGLPPSTLANLTPETPTKTGEGDAKITRQRATLNLGHITLPQIGRFIDAWRTAEPGWTISSIDLSSQSGAKESPGRDLPLRAVIVIETVFMTEPAANPPPANPFFPLRTANTGGKP